MRKSAKIALGAAAALVLGTGAAQAASAEFHTMKVALPDGAVAHILYAGDVAPKIEVRTADAAAPAAFDSMFLPMTAFPGSDILARMDRISAMMDRQMDAMMRQAAYLRQNLPMNGFGTPGIAMAGNLPAGAHVRYVATTTDSSGCTRTVTYNSDGLDAPQNTAPRLTRTASGSCDTRGPAAAIPVSAQAPHAAAPAPGTI